MPFCYRPLDARWVYWEPETKLLDEKRAEYFAHVCVGNAWFSAAQRTRRDFDAPLVTAHLSCRHLIERGANLFPLYLKGSDLLGGGGMEPNVSESAGSYLARLGVAPKDLFHHTVAVLHAPAYATENGGALLQDWPRIPLPNGADALMASAGLGRHLVHLLDPDCGVEGVTLTPLRSEIMATGPITAVDFGAHQNWPSSARLE